MLTEKIHRALSVRRTGTDYSKLHKWIDAGNTEISIDSPILTHTHTKELEKYVEKTFGGQEAVSEWLFHIAIDRLDTSVIFDWKNKLTDKNLYELGFFKKGYIHYEVQKRDEKELAKTESLPTKVFERAQQK